MYDVPYYFDTAFLASIIQFPAENQSEAYKDLTCTETDQATIYEIITTISENGKLGLLVKKGYLQGLGAQINHVHPLKFLSTIVLHPDLRGCLYGIFDDYFKRNGFMDGIGPSLTREADKGRLDQYIEDFSKETSIPQDKLAKYFQNRDWEGLVRFYIENPES